MSKQIASALLNPVPSRTRPSNPPTVPPDLGLDPVPIEIRRFRVEVQGSRRKRDLAAVAADDARLERERLAALGPPDELDDGDLEAIASAFDSLAEAVPGSTYALWLQPLQPVGARGDVLHLTAPDSVRSWVERRYVTLIRDALEAAGARFSEVSFSPLEAVI